MKLSDIVDVQPGFKAAVDISRDLENENKIKGYIPTENSIKVIEQVFEYFKPHISTRPIILTGTYGTGKSHLGLIIATLLRKNIGDNLYKTLLSKFENSCVSVAKKIKDNKENYGEKPYLLVYLEAEKVDWGSGFFNNSLILALREALKREKLESLTLKIVYDRALDRIQEIRQKYPDAYNQFEKEVANKDYYSVKDLEYKLRKFNKKALMDFADMHKKISAGAEFDWFSGMKASDFYISTVEALRKKGYEGILLIWDEFTPVLRKLVEDPLSGEALAFQNFAQACESSGINKILSLFISIRDIQDMLSRVSVDTFQGESIRKDAEKISARFRPMRLGHIDRESYYLMKGIIIHKEKFKEFKQKHNEHFLEIKNKMEELNLFYEYKLTSSDKKIIAEDLYPLQPLTTLVLSRLTDKVGQRERTIFTFLCDNGEGTFKDFLEKNEISERYLPFLYPFELENYFLPLIRQSQNNKELRGLTKKYEDTIILLPKDEVSKKIIKTIFLLNAAGISSTTEHIFFSLGCFTKKRKKGVKAKLEDLKNEKKITQKLSDNSWRFFGQGSDVAMDDHVREMASEIYRLFPNKELFNDAIQQIGVKEGHRSIKAENYNIDRTLERKVNIEFITAKELEHPESLQKPIQEEYRDGAYYFVLATTEKEISIVRKNIKQLFSKDTNILFALPADATLFKEIIPYLRKLKALEELPEKYPQYKSELRGELISEEDDTKLFLRQKLDKLLNPSKGYIEFYYQGEKKEIKAINKLRELVSQMMGNTFPYTPSIAREELIKEEGNDIFRSRYRIPLINIVLSPKAPSLLIQETDTVKNHIIEVIYKRHNILQQSASKWVIDKPRSSPDNNAMVKIWNTIDDFIKTDIYKEFPELIKILRLPPFGLKQRTIGLILSSVLRKYVLQNNLILEWKEQPIGKIDGELIEDRIILKQQQIKFRFQKITEKHKVILKSVAEVFNCNEMDLESVYRTVVNWWRELPQYSRNTKAISEQAKGLKESFFEPLSTQEKDKGELFYSILPISIGIEDLSRKTDQEVETTTNKGFKQIKDEFEGLMPKLHKEIRLAIIEIFEKEENLFKYYSSLPKDIQKYIFTGDAGKLINWLKEIDTKKKIELEDFVRIAEEILGKCTNWNDEQVIKLKGHLESAKNQIESYKPIISTDSSKERETFRKIFKIGDVERVFTLYEDLNKTPNKEQVQIILNVIKNKLLSAYKNGQITNDELLSIFYHLIKESEK